MSKLTDDLKALRDLDDRELLGHVHAQHLTAYAERRLDERIVGYVEDHLQQCEVCRDAVETLRTTAAAAAATVPDRRRSGGLWDRLRRTVLAPASAAVYLVLAVVLAGWWMTRGPEPDVTVLPPAVPLFSDDTLRGDDAELEPVPLPAPEGQPLVLKLHTDLRPGEATGPLIVRVESGGDTLVEQRIAAADVPADGALMLILPAEAVMTGRVYRVDVEAPGALPFAASFRIEVSP